MENEGLGEKGECIKNGIKGPKIASILAIHYTNFGGGSTASLLAGGKGILRMGGGGMHNKCNAFLCLGRNAQPIIQQQG